MSPRRKLGCLTQVILLLVLGLGLVVGADAIFAPWAYYLGGRFHLLPLWQGAGTLHAKSGDYVLQLWMSPAPGGRTFNLPYWSGTATLCTPRGERYSLQLSASMFEHPGLDTNGQRMEISMYTRRWNYSFTRDGRPRLTLRGRWQNPDLVMDDGGTLSRAFLPDNTVYRGPASREPPAREMVPIVVHETPWSESLFGCRAHS